MAASLSIDSTCIVAPLDMTASFESLESAFAATWPVAEWRDLNVVVAVSGGADSVALLRAVASAKSAAGGTGRIYVAHLNHALRPESVDDLHWVAQLCSRLNLPLETAVAETAIAADQQGDGIEAAARAVRYEFLLAVAHRIGARFVATAHTADDQVETVLQRILRGTGVAGLAGIPFARQLSASVSVVRPLLYVSRAQVCDYLEQLGQEYCTDPSNADLRINRNRLRHKLLPLLRAEFNSDVEAAILRLASQADEAQQCIAELARRQCLEAFKVSARGIEIDASTLAEKSPLLVREACKQVWASAGWPLQDMGYSEWRELATMILEARPTMLNLPGGIRAERTSNADIVVRFL